MKLSIIALVITLLFLNFSVDLVIGGLSDITFKQVCKDSINVCKWKKGRIPKEGKRCDTVVGGKDECIVFVYARDRDGLWVEFEFESLGEDFEDEELNDGYDPQLSLSGDNISVVLQDGFNDNSVQTGVEYILTIGYSSDKLEWEKPQNLFVGDQQEDTEFGSTIPFSANDIVVGYNKKGATYVFLRNEDGAVTTN